MKRLIFITSAVVVAAAMAVYIRLGCVDSSVSACVNMTPPAVHQSAFAEFLSMWGV